MTPAYRNYGCRLSEYTMQGMKVLFLENEFLRVGILVDKGADIFQFLYKPLDTEFLLHTPRGIRPAATQNVASNWGSFLDYYEGGWQEILPNGGPACTHKGVDYGLHGEITTVPWQYQIETDTPECVRVTLAVRPFRTPFYLQRTMTLNQGESSLIITETLQNEGLETLDFMWGHHPAFGAPFLSPDCRIDLPGDDLLIETFAGAAGTRLQGGSKHAWPLVAEANGVSVDFSRPDPEGIQHEDLGYVINLPEGWYAITNQQKNVGFAMTWSLETFPYLWVWRQFNQSSGYPWFGQVYTLALEPWSSYPSAGLTTAVANSTAAQIEPGESKTTELRAIAYQGVQQVQHVSPAGEVRGI